MHQFPSAESIAERIETLGDFHKLFILTLQAHFADQILTSFAVSYKLCTLVPIYNKIPENFWRNFLVECGCTAEFVDDALEI